MCPYASSYYDKNTLITRCYLKQTMWYSAVTGFRKQSLSARPGGVIAAADGRSVEAKARSVGSDRGQVRRNVRRFREKSLFSRNFQGVMKSYYDDFCTLHRIVSSGMEPHFSRILRGRWGTATLPCHCLPLLAAPLFAPPGCSALPSLASNALRQSPACVPTRL